MKIVIDQNISAARNIFLPHGDVVLVDGRKLSRKQLQGVDALVIRSVTQVDATLLQGTGVGFVGSTTIGTDHLDIPWLEQQGIHWASAPGCNADSAAQYTLAMMWLACERLGREFKDQRVGIIGRGNVGSRVERLLNALGVTTVANDPPLADGGVAGLVPLGQALAQDIVSLHVPLTSAGRYPTRPLLGRPMLNSIRTGALLVNCARGHVVDGQALKQCLLNGKLHAALDVWPGEPDIDVDLLDRTTVATPHVAGYSDDGKRNGAWIIYRAFCAWAGTEPLPMQSHADAIIDYSVADEDRAVAEALDVSCFVSAQDRAMRGLICLPRAERAAEFDRFRREYPQRRDFKAWRVHSSSEQSRAVLRQLGFSVGNQA